MTAPVTLPPPAEEMRADTHAARDRFLLAMVLTGEAAELLATAVRRHTDLAVAFWNALAARPFTSDGDALTAAVDALTAAAVAHPPPVAEAAAVAACATAAVAMEYVARDHADARSATALFVLESKSARALVQPDAADVRERRAALFVLPLPHGRV